MRAALGDTALVEHDDAIGVFHGRQPMRNDEGSTATQERRQAGLYQEFSFGIDASSGFVEHENARIGQQGARKAEQLALAVAEQATALTHVGVVAVGQTYNELV